MSDKKPNHAADIQNPNKGTPGTNITWDKNQGNRGAQLNPNRNPAPKAPAGGKRGGK
ncbi:MAG: hypothetical protein IV100_15995 [Myxococcales bacterium]|nr:hypothetical protein [Myxococcales bacterium]